MASTDTELGRLLLDQEEALLARKRAAIKKAGASLEQMRSATDQAREATAELRGLGFSQRDIVRAFNMSRTEVRDMFPRKGRAGSGDGVAADAEESRGGQMDQRAEQPREGVQ